MDSLRAGVRRLTRKKLRPVPEGFLFQMSRELMVQITRVTLVEPPALGSILVMPKWVALV